MNRGALVTLEGGEGAGKSTVLAAVRDALAAHGLNVEVTREPGGTALGEAVRALVLDPAHAGLCAESELLLMFASRAQLVRERIEPALARGDWVLSDRFTDASFAYQGAGHGADTAVLTQLEAWVQQGRQPDLTLWFDLPAADAAARRAAVRAPDRFERQDEAFFTRVRDAYAERADLAPARFRRLEARGSREQVWQRVQAQLLATGWW